MRSITTAFLVGTSVGAGYACPSNRHKIAQPAARWDRVTAPPTAPPAALFSRGAGERGLSKRREKGTSNIPPERHRPRSQFTGKCWISPFPAPLEKIGQARDVRVPGPPAGSARPD